MERADDIEAFVADHFGDTHTLSLPRAVFVELGGYPAGFSVCEDVHLLVRLVARSRRIGVVCAMLGVYVIHGGSATRRDPVAAQRENVRTLLDLDAVREPFPFAGTAGCSPAAAAGTLQPGLRACAHDGARRRRARGPAVVGGKPGLGQRA